MYLPCTPCLVFVWISSPGNSATLHICLLAPKELLLYSHGPSSIYVTLHNTQSTYHCLWISINVLSSLCMRSINMLWPRFHVDFQYVCHVQYYSSDTHYCLLCFPITWIFRWCNSANLHICSVSFYIVIQTRLSW